MEKNTNFASLINSLHEVLKNNNLTADEKALINVAIRQLENTENQETNDYFILLKQLLNVLSIYLSDEIIEILRGLIEMLRGFLE